MNNHINASSVLNQDAEIHIKQSNIHSGISSKTVDILTNPAELFLDLFAGNRLKNVEHFSRMMPFSYTMATLEIQATHLENPLRRNYIIYDLTVYSNNSKFNIDLFKKNLDKFGTIFNTVKLSSEISGAIKTIANV